MSVQEPIYNLTYHPAVTGELDHAYTRMVLSLLKSGDSIKQSMTTQTANLLHLALGVCGEAGELADGLKKYCIYGKPLDRANIVEELGDLEFYMEGLRNALNIERSETLRSNMGKLAIRYGTAYTDTAAQARKDKA